MHITDFTIGAAVLRIFRDLRVFHPGGTLRIESIRELWIESGLRNRDLEPGIAWLVDNHFLVRGSTAAVGDATLLSLTQAGSDHISGLPRTISDWFNAIGTAMALAAARRRAQSNKFWNRVRCGYHGFRSETTSTSKA